MKISKLIEQINDAVAMLPDPENTPVKVLLGGVFYDERELYLYMVYDKSNVPFLLLTDEYGEPYR